jgi:hypothetical protein
MAEPSQSPRALELPYRWADREGSVRVELRENDDPAALGCPDFACGYPYCRATVEPPGRGYQDILGWLPMVNSNRHENEFVIDPFVPIGPVALNPFPFLGWAPVFFDAPHSDFESWDFLAHSFLCGLGGELHDFRREVRAILGFTWGFSQRGSEIEFIGPDALSAADWARHRDYLEETFPDWTFAPGFHQHPLRP